jgi:Neocarzinostatin family
MRLTRLLRCLGAGVGVFAAATVALASPASAQPMITVTPDTDLVDFQTVTVTGSGFAAESTVGMAMCTAGSLSVDNCDLDTSELVQSDATGGFTTDYTVERLIETPVSGPVDCLDASWEWPISPTSPRARRHRWGSTPTFRPSHASKLA